MALERIPAKTLIFIALVFLALVVVQLRWSADVEEKTAADQEGPRVSRIQISKGGRLVDVETERGLTTAKPEELVEAGIALLAKDTPNERRTGAIELAYMANEPAERGKLVGLNASLKTKLRQALLKGLQDADAPVAKSCGEALIGWWRMSKSTAITECFQQGLAAYEAGQLDAALQAFQNIEALGDAVPADLYRMRAEVYLGRSLPEKALTECRRALEGEPKHFMALYVQAKAYAQTGQNSKALESLNQALSIYTAFPEAQRLRARLSDSP